MLHTFFENTEKSNAALFKGTKVWKNVAHRAEQGKYPVLHITLKDAKKGVWTDTLGKIAEAMRIEFKRHKNVFLSQDCEKDVRSF